MARSLEGLRILVVEDEYLIARDIKRIIETLGAAVVGPTPRAARGMELAAREPIDGAVMDVNLGDHTIAPLAETLLARGVPMILATGYGAAVLPPALAATPRLHKPFDDEGLRHMAETVFGRSS